MAEVEITWTDGYRFVATDSTKHSVVMSSTGDGRGMKPSDLLLVALGGCVAVDVVGILEKKRQKVTGISIRVTGEQDNEPPWAFRRIHQAFVIRGRNLSVPAITQAIELSIKKYCSVHATVSGVAEVTSDFEIIEEGASEPVTETLSLAR
ncbi:MAG: hypothetical protein A2Z04_05160 [Chloroflexi bacterium RBG_16_57_9]|nr:MAG: hypothetical protein A2Z04_05160 [Chloroflexi bacterium RBG_16_57_9]